MTSVEEVKAQIGAAVQAAKKATEVLATANASMDQALQLVGEASRGSSHDKIGESLRAFAEAKRRLEDATGAAQQGINTAEHYLSVI